MKRRLSMDNTSEESELKKPELKIACGPVARLRQQARREVDNSSTPINRVHGVEHSADMDASFAISSQYIDSEQLLELKRRPPVSFLVQNAGSERKLAAKEDAILAPSQLPTQYGSDHHEKQSTTKRSVTQSWYSPVHVPLTHRKLVQAPSIFSNESWSPVHPIAPRPPPCLSASSGNKPQYKRKLIQPSPRDTAAISSSNQNVSLKEQLNDGSFLRTLRETNKEIYDRLVKRFQSIKRLNRSDPRSGVKEEAPLPQGEQFEPSNNAITGRTGGPVSVEDAILFFLNEKHKHDVFYFKQKRSNDHQTQRLERSISLGVPTSFVSSSKLSEPTSRYMPYDLSRTDHCPAAGDYYIMSSSSLVHHSNNGGSDIVGEVIPISQWVMESKLFSLLLAGIPLFQKFLIQRVFIRWRQAVCQKIFQQLRGRLAQSLPLARKAFAAPMIESLHVLRYIQGIRSLSLPIKRPAMSISALQDRHKELLSVVETELIDAKEELLSVTDIMIQGIQQDLDPSTNLDELYHAEASIMHVANTKWRSTPISAFRRRRADLDHHNNTAKLDLALLGNYVRLMEYMFSESVYLMIIGCVRHITAELSADENTGVICASVTLEGDRLILSPSVTEMKCALLEDIARLVRLASNLHFTKNAIIWSSSRGTGALAIVASSLASDALSMQFDLQGVLRKDPAFDAATCELIKELTKWFDEAAHQLAAFQSLKIIQAAVYSIRPGVQVVNTEVRVESNPSRSYQYQLPRELTQITNISGIELGRYLKNQENRLSVLDRSQHACQKIQSSWKVGFLEIQCRHSISDISDVIAHERNTLHQTLYRLVTKGIADCVATLQQSTAVYEDRPQLIECFCEQMKQIRILQDGDKQLQQDVRNVDESIRALKRYAPSLAGEIMVQYNFLHNLFDKYLSSVQSYEKFSAKMLPNITQQVHSTLQKYSLRIQRLLRTYDDFSNITTKEELEKCTGMFHDITKELHSIAYSTKLYLEYQKMVGLKITDIPLLSETIAKWEDVHEVVRLVNQWRDTTESMEKGIIIDQNWRLHIECVEAMLVKIHQFQQQREISFISQLVENTRISMVSYLQQLQLVMDMTQPFLKIHHWQQILALLDIVNFVSSTGVLVMDGSSITLGFLLNRNFWKVGAQIREIIRIAHHDSISQKRLDEMKDRFLLEATPLIKTGDSYMIDVMKGAEILELLEDDRLTIQSLAQTTSTSELHCSLIQWGEELNRYYQVLEMWMSAQNDWIKLGLLFYYRDIQQCVNDTAFEYQVVDRKWKTMMTSAASAVSLKACLSDVVSIGFLMSARFTFEKVWKQLGGYLYKKRQLFPRFYFLSDEDLLLLTVSTQNPKQLNRLISKCFFEIHSLLITTVCGGVGENINNSLREAGSDVHHRAITVTEFSTADGVVGGDQNCEPKPIGTTSESLDMFIVEGVYGMKEGEILKIAPLCISSSSELWMKDLANRVRESVQNVFCVTMEGMLVGLFEDNFAALKKHREHGFKSEEMASTSSYSPMQGISKGSTTRLLQRELSSNYQDTDPIWDEIPFQVIILCMYTLLTNELTHLVQLDRFGDDWKYFWQRFEIKKSNLVEFIKRCDCISRDRWIATNILVILLNKAHGIRELYDEEPLPIALDVSTQFRVSNDVSSYHYSYSASDSFSWTKLMRFYYEPFERKCVIHQAVKTFDYGFAYLGKYSCAVLSPLSDRVILAMSVALSLENGVLLHAPSGISTGKRTIVRELANTVGVECFAYDFSIGVGYTHFKQVLNGILQCMALWGCFTGLEILTTTHPQNNFIRIFAQEMNRLKDVVRGGLNVFLSGGKPVEITNTNLAMFVTTSLDCQYHHNHESFMRLSYSFVPVACTHIDHEVMWATLLCAHGINEWRELSRKLDTVFRLLGKDFAQGFVVSPSVLPLIFAVVNNIVQQHIQNRWKPEEKCVVIAIWEEVHAKISPERQVAFLKCLRTVFPSAQDFEITSCCLLATKTHVDSVNSNISSEDAPNRYNVSNGFEASVVRAPLAYDSDEEDKHGELQAVKKQIEKSMQAKQFSSSEFFVRKVLEAYQVVTQSIVIIVAGHGPCGKSSAIDILSSVFAVNTTKLNGSKDKITEFADRIKTIRLYPTAFPISSIYGQFQDQEQNIWSDGILTHFFRQNCTDTVSSLSFADSCIRSTGHLNNDTSKTTLPHRDSASSSKNSSDGSRSTSSTSAPPTWIVLDGMGDAAFLLDPLRDLAMTNPTSRMKLVLPNGDQLHCENGNLRIFCEVDSLQHWSPICLSRFGLVHLQADNMLPYTLLIKRWSQQQCIDSNSDRESQEAHPLIDFATKLMRSNFPSLLDICKRHTKPFMDFCVTHAVGNMLLILTLFMKDLLQNFQQNDKNMWTSDTRIVVAYAATMTLGLSLQGKGRAKFNHIVMNSILPDIRQTHSEIFSDSSVTLVDIGLRFDNHRVQLFRWTSLMQQGSDRLPSLDYWNPCVSRRNSARRANEDSSDDSVNFGGEQAAVDSSLRIPSYSIYIPTAYTIGCKEWLTQLAVAKMNVFLYGDAGVGKTRILEHALHHISIQERIITNILQINRHTSAQNIQHIIENGLPHKLKGLYCPPPGKRSFVVLLENLNLEDEVSFGRTRYPQRPCSAMIRQVLDGKGSFIDATKDFVQFKDLVLWCSFSLGTFGYPSLRYRLLRHFHVIWFPDQSNHIFDHILSSFPDQFMERYRCLDKDVATSLKRVLRYSIDVFKTARKCWEPSIFTPQYLLSVGDIMRFYTRMLTVARSATENLLELELLSLHFTFQTFRNRVLSPSDEELFSSKRLQIAQKLQFSDEIIDYVERPSQYFFADYGDTIGCIRITDHAAMELLLTAEENVNWNDKPLTERATTGVFIDSTQTQAEASVSSAESFDQTITGSHLSMHSGVSAALSKPHTFSKSDTISPSKRNQDQSNEPPYRSTHASTAAKSVKCDKNTTASSLLLHNMLDLYSFLQNREHQLILYGADTFDHRRTTMLACCALSFQFREIKAQVERHEFIDRLKAVVMMAGLKSTNTVIYVECTDLSEGEFAVILQLLVLRDLPSELYSSSDKTNIRGYEQQFRTSHGITMNQSASIEDAISEQRENSGSMIPTAAFQERSMYSESLRKCLYIVLSFRKPARLFELVTCYPSVYYQSVVKTFSASEYDHLKTMDRTYLSEWALLNEAHVSTSDRESRFDETSLYEDFHAMMLSIYHAATESLNEHPSENAWSSDRTFSVVRTRFDEFLRIFKVSLTFQKQKLGEEQTRVQQAIQFLDKKLHQAKVNLACEINCELSLEEAKREVENSSAKLRHYEMMERDAKRAFLLDEQRLAVLQGEVEQERAIIQAELAKTLPEVREATAALSQINKHHITEMKSFTNPPQLVRLAMQAVCVLLDVPPTWGEALRILADIRFLDRLRSFDRDHVDPSLIENVKFYVNHPDFSMENMKRASVASTTLCKWVLAIVRYFEVMKHVGPTQRRLDEAQRNYDVIDEAVQAERKKMIDLELQLNDLRAAHLINVKNEEELQHTHISRMRRKDEVAHFCNVLVQWKEILHKHSIVLHQQQANLIGDCAIVVALTLFASELQHQKRLSLTDKWRKCIQKSFTSSLNLNLGIHDMHPLIQRWRLDEDCVTSELKQEIDVMKDKNEDSLVTSLFLMDQVQSVCLKYPLLLDPLDRGTCWLKEKLGSLRSSSLMSELSNATGGEEQEEQTSPPITALLVLDAGDPSLISAIEKRLTLQIPPLVLINNLSECQASDLNTILDLLQLIQGDHRIYFATKTLDKMLEWPPKIWSQLAVVDFTPTFTDLNNIFMSLFFRHYGTESNTEDTFELVKAKLGMATTQLEQFMQLFMANCLASESERTNRQTNAQSRSTRKEKSANDGKAHEEYGMSELSKKLDEFKAVEMHIMNLRDELSKICEQRQDARVFASRACGYVLSEHRLRTSHALLPIPLPQLVLCVKECLEQSAISQKTEHNDGVLSIYAPNEDGYAEATPSATKTTKQVAEKATELVTLRFLHHRLLGLPTQLHQSFLLLSALSYSEMEENAENAVLLQNIVHHVAKNVTFLSEYEEVTKKSPAKQIASHFVRCVVEGTIALISELTATQFHDRNPPNQYKNLDYQLYFAYAKIQRAFSTHAETVRQDKFTRQLHEDMVKHHSVWKTYLQSPPSSLGGRISNESLDDNADESSAPVWFTNSLTIFEQLLVYFCLFECVNTTICDEVITRCVGERIIRQLNSVSDERMGTTMHSLARNTKISIPILLLSSPSSHVAVANSSVMQAARANGIPIDSLSCFSVGMEQNQANDSRSRRASDKDHVDNDGDFSDDDESLQPILKDIEEIKEKLASGNWIIIENIHLAPLYVKNALRLQIENTKDLLPNTKNQHFRLWLLYELPQFTQSPGNSTKEKKILADPSMTGLASLPVQRYFLEYPQTLMRLYYRYMQEKLECTHEVRQQHPQGQSPQSNRQGTNPANAMSFSSFPLGQEQRWIRTALWIFHSLLRLHLEDTISDETQNNLETTRISSTWIPTDLFISYLELERAIRLIQLHGRQRILAGMVATANSVTSSGCSVNSMSTRDLHHLVELSSLIYTGRQWNPVRARQCCQLLMWCFEQSPRDHSSDLDLFGDTKTCLSTKDRILKLRDQLSNDEIPIHQRIDEQIELTLLPRSLQRQKDTSHAMLALRNLKVVTSQKLVHDFSTENVVDRSAEIGNLIRSAQNVLRSLMCKFPNRASLTKGLQHQQKQRHVSMLRSWQKRANDTPSITTPRSNAPASQEGWRIAAIRHLAEVELPGMEAYLTHIWNMTEIILLLDANSHEILTFNTTGASTYQDIQQILRALSERKVPATWSDKGCISVNQHHHLQQTVVPSSAGYPVPLYLTCWCVWLKNAVAFYQSFQLHSHMNSSIWDDMVIWLPGLKYPKDLLVTLQHACAIAKDISFHDLSFQIAASGDARRGSLSTQTQEVLASIKVSGLVLSNASWCTERGVLVEDDGSGTTQPLSPVTLHLTTRFKGDHWRQFASAPPSSYHYFYCCPLYPSRKQLMTLEEPLAYFYMPTDHQSEAIMAVNGTALFLLQDGN